MKKYFLTLLISLIIVTGCESKKEENLTKIVENNGMLSYTIDGEKTDLKPTKEDGYIVNKIICDNGSDMMWDNDNWEVELTKVNSKDRCKVDFTKDTSKEGYRVTVTSNMTSALDSLSKATTENGTVIIYSTSKIESVTGCNGVINDNKVIISNINFNQTCNIEVEDKTLVGIIKKAYRPQEGRTDFSTIDNGIPRLYTDIDDQGTTYYFSGNGTNMNNWVSFVGKMWRIIRINGNGSVRLLYVGSGGEDGYIGSAQYYAPSDGASNHPAYVGWKYTIGGSLSANRENKIESVVYSSLKSWYNDLNSTYKNYIDIDAIYCNDRSITNGTYSSSRSFDYAVYTRLSGSSSNPTFICNVEADKFAGKKGDIPVGLMTADEVIYAGGKWNTNNSTAYYYLNASGGSATGSNFWWTMSPAQWVPSYARIFLVIGSSSNQYGYLGVGNAKSVIRPVISLKKEVKVTSGNGSAENPYEVTI